MGITDKVKASARYFFSSSVPNHSKVVPSDCYNILLLGETQVGKSTFIQAICRYANPKCQLKSDAIGDGFHSCTNDVIRHSIITNLPSFKVVNTKLRLEPHGPPLVVDYEDILSTGSLVDYDKVLNEHQTPDGPFELKSNGTSNQQIRFNLYDTPGLNDSNHNDELHVANIFDAVKRAGKIHMVLIAVGQGPCSPGLQEAIRCYLDIFPQFQDIMTIVHTKTDYKLLHPMDPTRLERKRAARISTLHEIIGRDNFPHYWIDCDLYCNKPVRKCITQNTIQKILKVAILNQPISLEATMIHKSPKMRAIDELVEDKYGSLSKLLVSTHDHKNDEHDKLRSKALESIDKIVKVESDLKNAEDFIEAHETDELELLDEFLRSEEWGLFRMARTDSVSLTGKGFTIDVMNVFHPGFYLSDEKGGEGSKTWSACYQRKRYNSGTLHIRCYAKKCNKYKTEIEYTKKLLDGLKRLHKVLNELHQKQAKESREIHAEVEDLAKKNNFYIQIVKIARGDRMKPDLFRALAEAGAYRGTPAQCISKVINVFEGFFNGPDVIAPFRDKVDVLLHTSEAQPQSDPIINDAADSDNVEEYYHLETLDEKHHQFVSEVVGEFDSESNRPDVNAPFRDKDDVLLHTSGAQPQSDHIINDAADSNNFEEHYHLETLDDNDHQFGSEFVGEFGSESDSGSHSESDCGYDGDEIQF